MTPAHAPAAQVAPAKPAAPAQADPALADPAMPAHATRAMPPIPGADGLSKVPGVGLLTSGAVPLPVGAGGLGG